MTDLDPTGSHAEPCGVLHESARLQVLGGHSVTRSFSLGSNWVVHVSTRMKRESTERRAFIGSTAVHDTYTFSLRDFL